MESINGKIAHIEQCMWTAIRYEVEMKILPSTIATVSDEQIEYANKNLERLLKYRKTTATRYFEESDPTVKGYLMNMFVEVDENIKCMLGMI